MNPWIAALILVLIASVLLGVVALKSSLEKSAAPIAIERCIALCEEAKKKGVDLSSGPCLSNEVAPGWVCDVAHWPRQPVDDLPENQCPAFGKTASHFVEVDENCQVIRVY